MTVTIEPGKIHYSLGCIETAYPVLEAREIGRLVVVVYDYMSFPQDKPARNLFAYDRHTGEEEWRAQDIGLGQTDAYTKILSDAPLLVGNFASYICRVDPRNGRVIEKEFTK
jgi:hypothetical protein